MHHDDSIVLKIKDVDHDRKVLGMSETVFLRIPSKKQKERIKDAIEEAGEYYWGNRDYLRGYFKML